MAVRADQFQRAPTTSLITYVLLVAILGGPFVAARALVGDDWKEVAVWLISKIVVFVLCLVLSFSAAVAIRLLQGISGKYLSTVPTLQKTFMFRESDCAPHENPCSVSGLIR